MAVPVAAVAAGIGAISSAQTNLLNIGSQMLQNRWNRKFAEKQYATQRADNLADRAFENEYNSPANQMARLKAAGLNPNLVYDNGAAKSVSASTNTATMPSYRGEAPQINNAGFVDSINSYFSNQMREAQTDNIKAATEVAKQEAVNKFLQSANIISTNEGLKLGNSAKSLALQHAKNMNPVILDQAKASLDQTIANTTYTRNSDSRAATMNAVTVQQVKAQTAATLKQTVKTQAEINQINQNIKNSKIDEKLKQLDYDLRRIGVNPNDPTWQRVMGSAANKLLGEGWADKAADKIKRGFRAIGAFR